MKKHRVKVQFIFDGYFDIVADNGQQAREIANRDCGLVMGGSIYTSNDEQVKDWDFPIHSETNVVSVKRLK